MKTLYLWVDDEGWMPFQYNELSELANELAARNIKLGDRCELGNWCKLGYGCKLGDECELGNWCELGYGCELGDRCELGDECELGNWCELGYECELGYGCELGDRCELGNGCKLGYECKLGYGCKLGDRCELGNGCKLGNRLNVPKSLFINASRHALSYWGEDAIQIGCQRFSIAEWQRHYKKIGEKENYTSDQIEEYKRYIDLIATMHNTWCIEKSEDK